MKKKIGKIKKTMIVLQDLNKQTTNVNNLTESKPKTNYIVKTKQ